MPRRFLSLSAALVALTAVAVPFATADAAWVAVRSVDPAPLGVTVLESSPERTVLEFVLPGYFKDEVMVEGEPCVSLSVPGEAQLMLQGLPEIPMARRSVIVDDTMPVEARLLEIDELTVPIGRVVPSKGHLDRNVDPATVPYEFGPSYNEDAWFPAETLAADRPFIVRDFRGATVEFHPLRYHPLKGELRVCRRLVVEVTRGSGTAANTLARRPAAGDDGAFQLIYRDLFLNYDSVGNLLYDPIPEPGRLVIITADEFHDDMLPFLEWKLQQGRPTELVLYSDVGTGSAAVKDYIDSVYYSTEGLTYVILVGDVQQIPTLYGTYQGAPSDPCYAKIQGDDHYPDIFISRLSAQSSTHVATQVNRLVRYARDPDAGTAAEWYHEGTGIGSNETGGTGIPDWERVDWLRENLLNYTYTHVDQIYDPGATASQVSAALNDGRSIVNYVGHGSIYGWGTTGFSVTNVHNLTNGHMLPFIISVACDNGDFTVSECFAEAWLRSGTAETPKGAMAIFAASTGASWVPPCDMQSHSIDLLVTEQRNTVGGLFFFGVMYAMDRWGSGEGSKLMEQFNIFGDCSLIVRTDSPSELTVSHPSLVLMGMATFEVEVPGVEGALVALYDNGILYGFAYTDGSGHALITMDDPPDEPGIVTLTVTTYNRAPYITTLPVTPVEGPLLVSLAHELDDDDVGESRGNGDGGLDAGETAEFGFSVWNMGADPAYGVTATFTGAHQHVDLLDSTEVLGDIASGETLVCGDPMLFVVSAECPDEELLSFTLALAAGSDEWSQPLSYPVQAPILAVGGYVITEVVGDGDGNPDPGEEVELELTLANQGTGEASGLMVTLTSAISWAEVTEDSAGASFLAGGGTMTLTPPFLVSVSPDAPEMALSPMWVELAGDLNLAWNASFNMAIGGLRDDVEDGVGEWTHTVVTPDFVDQWHRTMFGNHTPGGMWCWKFGGFFDSDYANLADGALVSAPLGIGDGSSLTFWHYIDAETSVYYGAYAYDGGAIEISLEGGPWEQLTPEGGYPYLIRRGINPGPFPQGYPVFSGSHGWQEETVDLSGYSGQAEIRFRFGSNGTNTRHGWFIDDVEILGGETGTDVPGTSLVLTPAPKSPLLGQNRPNPFNPSTVIEYALPREAAVTLSVYDVSGRLVRTLASGIEGSGTHRVNWNGQDESGREMASGVYFYRLTIGDETLTRSMVLLK